ncbi:hypothetical protein CGT89_16625 [Vibrio cholerae]|nr:hypothetical protein CGT89_16625 [Vibrio cholerae]PAR70545.1 hypothetical protein CGT88_18335 [Vibrio cholerae]
MKTKLLVFCLHNLAFEFKSDADSVESVGSSAVSKLLKTNKPRCFNVVGCSTLQVWFHKSGIIAVSVISLSLIR